MEEQKEYTKEVMKDCEKGHRRGKVSGGLLVVAVGSLFLARELGAQIPEWIFTWKSLLVGIGLAMGLKHGFRNPGWLFPLFIGGSFLMVDFYPEMNIKSLLWPILIIIIGLVIIFKPKRKRHHWNKWQRWQQRREWRTGNTKYPSYDYNFGEYEHTSEEDFINSTAFMGGVKKNIMSKNFKGGDITNVFGGTELNLSQADFTGEANLEVTQVFGGTKLVIPANWEVRSELVTVFGSVEDKRPTQSLPTGEPLKILRLTGTTVLGGMEIRSY